VLARVGTQLLQAGQQPLMQQNSLMRHGVAGQRCVVALLAHVSEVINNNTFDLASVTVASSTVRWTQVAVDKSRSCRTFARRLACLESLRLSRGSTATQKSHYEALLHGETDSPPRERRIPKACLWLAVQAPQECRSLCSCAVVAVVCVCGDGVGGWAAAHSAECAGKGADQPL
jgi:hypothetical protein